VNKLLFSNWKFIESVPGFLSTSVSPHLSPSVDAKVGLDGVDANHELQHLKLAILPKPAEVCPRFLKTKLCSGTGNCFKNLDR
jgi:hypothetical protein